MRQTTLYRYALPIKTGVILRKQPLTVREGLIVKLQENGREGWGEISPLPTFSHESLAQAEQQAQAWCAAWRAGETLPLENNVPSVAFGLSCALAELNNCLNAEGNYRSAVLCYGELDKLYQHFSHQQGELIGKLKVGIENTEQDGERANQLLDAFPNFKLRLDANRAWTLEQAVNFGKKIAKPNRLRIEFVEEPCANQALSRQFAAQTGIAIAWDESVREPDFLVKNEPNLTAIVLKPMLIGSLGKCVALIKQAHKQGLKAVISSSLESSLGLSQLARIAQQYTPESVPGLDTLGLMSVQLIRKWQSSDLPLCGVESEYLTEII